MISQETLDNFQKLVQIANETCRCNEDDPCCRKCAAMECLERISMEIAETLDDIAFEE